MPSASHVNQRHFEDDRRPFELLGSDFGRLDRAFGVLARQGIYFVTEERGASGTALDSPQLRVRAQASHHRSGSGSVMGWTLSADAW